MDNYGRSLNLCELKVMMLIDVAHHNNKISWLCYAAELIYSAHKSSPSHLCMPHDQFIQFANHNNHSHVTGRFIRHTHMSSQSFKLCFGINWFTTVISAIVRLQPCCKINLFSVLISANTTMLQGQLIRWTHLSYYSRVAGSTNSS